MRRRELNFNSVSNEPEYYRAKGRTTKLVDLFIQQIFMKEEVFISDHHPTRLAYQHIWNIILRRLEIEHGIKRTDFKIFDDKQFILQLK